MKTIKKKISHISTTENGKLFLEIELREPREWAFVGVEGPKSNGDCKGSCGQCDELFPEHIQKLWKKYHLNGMSAGTKEQNYFLESLKASGWKYEYKDACEKLKEAGLYEVQHEGKLYKYGHGWIYHANPDDQEIHDFFDSLKDDSDIYPWRD